MSSPISQECNSFNSSFDIFQYDSDMEYDLYPELRDRDYIYDADMTPELIQSLLKIRGMSKEEENKD